MITAFDADINDSDDHTEDKFRIKIWEVADDTNIVYDNQREFDDDSNAATAIGGGSIVIHKP